MTVPGKDAKLEKRKKEQPDKHERSQGCSFLEPSSEASLPTVPLTPYQPPESLDLLVPVLEDVEGVVHELHP